MAADQLGGCIKMRYLFVCVGFLALAACGTSQQGSGVTVSAPDSKAVSNVSIGGGSTAASVDLAAQRLKAAGFTVTSKSSGSVQAQATSLNNIDCGEVRQVALGNTSEFAGNSGVAVIYRSEDPIIFVTRSVSTKSSVVVDVSGDTAQIAEAHDVTITWRTAKKDLISNETKRVSGGSLVKFEDKTVCTSSGRVADVLEG